MLSLSHEIFINIEFIVYCALSLILGGIVGLEREFRRKPAGFRTHVLITLGATIITYISINMSPTADPTRIAAQIVSGIGFIGAGTIMQSRQVILGLTTAATLWASAGIGMLVGAGMMIQSIVGALIIFVFLVGSHRFTRAGSSPMKPYCLNIQIKKMPALEEIEHLIEKLDLVIESKTLTRAKDLELQMNYHATPLTQYVLMRSLLKIKGLREIVRA